MLVWDFYLGLILTKYFKKSAISLMTSEDKIDLLLWSMKKNGLITRN